MALFRLSADQVNYCRSIEHVCWGLLRKMVHTSDGPQKMKEDFLHLKSGGTGPTAAAESNELQTGPRVQTSHVSL